MTAEVKLEELQSFAQAFWKQVEDAKVFAFHGPMGAGKTTTINALCAAKGIHDLSGSPTFSIINEYMFEENGVQKELYHIDLYRLRDADEAIAAGVEECMFSGAICFIEWPERATSLFDNETVHVLIEPVNEHTRKITILSAAQFNAPD
ncbi:MAG TPA: tRNA (adenosine(37)-N6)-threonylcarbamoyltransferase complex ATPase subunit type 1 TsaE [Flavisolibacter sp.]|jgi:tRNA threonylcarbamoyladenosine biosynthesis protein TsaE